MVGINGCNLLNTKRDRRMPSEFTSKYHVHIIVRCGEMRFSDGKQEFVSQKDDLVIWQMSNSIQQINYSKDFEADFLIASGDFLSRFNPEMVWASKGFIFIRINPSFHLHERSLRLMNNDFNLFYNRLEHPDSPFKEEILGRVMQIFLYDLWTVYSDEMAQMENVAYYADALCITPKYLSQVCNSVSGLPASQWITFYATFELVTLLNDQSKTLTEVADMMNFETASHFSRYVKKLLGKSPSEYRQK